MVARHARFLPTACLPRCRQGTARRGCLERPPARRGCGRRPAGPSRRATYQLHRRGDRPARRGRRLSSRERDRHRAQPPHRQFRDGLLARRLDTGIVLMSSRCCRGRSSAARSRGSHRPSISPSATARIIRRRRSRSFSAASINCWPANPPRRGRPRRGWDRETLDAKSATE